jgi:hypothetical protein
LKKLNPEPREIDYRIRPAKNVERKMLLEICGRMAGLEPLANYRYVGMGSIYFVDFSLFHRAYGMKDMISIEGRENLKDRCEWNRPFDCVTVMPAPVGEALPELRSDVPTIMWLDYEEALDDEIIGQVEEACEILAHRSILIVTVNAHPGPLNQRVAKFRERFGDRDLSRTDTPEKLGQEKLRELYFEYLDTAVSTAISARKARDGAVQKQLAHFLYRDGVNMLSMAWLIHGEDEADAVRELDFDSLHFASDGAKPWHIEVPRLTYRERITLDKMLPDRTNEEIPDGVEAADVTAYATLYRQMPIYVDALI